MLVIWVSLVTQNLPAMQETWVWSLGQEDHLEKGNGQFYIHTHTRTHSLSVPKPMPIFAPTYRVWLYPALLSVQWVKNGIFVVFD